MMELPWMSGFTQILSQMASCLVPWNREMTIELLRKEAQAMIGDAAK